MPKRKAEDQAESSAHGESSKKAATTKKTTWNTKPESAKDAVIRLQTAGLAYRDLHEKSLSTSGKSADTQDQEWIESLAQHLVREPQYLKLMTNPPGTETIKFNKPWLASVHLVGRYHRFGSFQAFYAKWWEKFPDFRLSILDRAVEILEAAQPIIQSSVAKTKIPPPPATPEADKLRQDIFFFQTLRTRLVAAIQEATDIERAVMRRALAYGSSSGGPNNDASAAMDELNMLEDMKIEIRATLASSRTNSSGQQVLDGLLKQVVQQAEDLFGVPADAAEEVLGGSSEIAQPGTGEDESATLDPQIASTASADIQLAQTLNLINTKDQFITEYYDNQIAGSLDPVFTSAPRDTKSVDMDEEPQIDQLYTTGGLPDLDERVATALQRSALTLDLARFRANMYHFESLVERPARIRDVKKGASIFANQSARIVLVEDNMFHIKVLIAQIRDNGLLAENTSDAQLQEALRRLWALVAVMWGCAPEGSMWLTVMDSLLEDLARLVAGQADVRLNTATMQRFLQLRSGQAQTPAETVKLSANDIERLERQDRARQLFAEIARFFRGAVMLAFAGVSWDCKTTDVTGQKWYENLVRWSYICGAESCIERLQVRKFEKGGVGAASANRADLGLRSKYGLVIGVEDTRMGFPEERTVISQNRDWAYPCLYDLIHWSKWHPGFGPFFHYFGHMYHPACAPARGKNIFVLTVLAATNGP
ncbi:hypothetical protein LTR85_010583 [Meristemomyces frigidus]|nr:hypothetical protein LTR85_010583 [Meristemomyces frigidus]